MDNHTKHLEQTAMAWAVESLGSWLREATAAKQLCPMPDNGPDLGEYEAVLRGSYKSQQFPHLLSSLSVVYPVDKKQPVGKQLEPSVLHLDGQKTKVSWSGFVDEFKRLPTSNRFEGFTHLFHKYAWAVPSSYAQTVSLYEEFKGLAALLFASNGASQPADSFLLVGGDTSGIQAFIFTVSNKAAAKGLRGRSFFLQLVGDAIIRRLLDVLELPSVNVIYAAGGNFLLLAPVGVESKLKTVRRDVNEVLLAGTQGQLRMALGWSEMAATAVANPDQWREAMGKVKKNQQTAKQRPLAEVATDNWAAVFVPMDDGGEQFCAVCHRGIKVGETAVTRGEDIFCPLCDSFGNLASDIRHTDLWLSLHRETAVPALEWVRLLHQISGYTYRFSEKPNQTADYLYRLNHTDFLGNKAHGFRLLANVTPTMTAQDLKYADDEAIYYEHAPQVGNIRDFDVLARDGKGVKWLGILRMDVDNLGQLFTQWPPQRGMVLTSALSSSLEQFFSGRLNHIVRAVATLDKGQEDERLAAYIIYAGGDDLFVVGAWHLLPKLAQAIHEEFHDYTHNEHLTISAGIGLMPRTKYPLYLAAKDAHHALDDQAKEERWELIVPDKTSRVERHTAAKNAISFLGTSVGWHNWPQIVALQEKLVMMQDEKQVSRSLIQFLQQVHTLFETGRKRYEKDHPEAVQGEQKVYPAYYGRWQWLLRYQFSRIKQKQNKEVRDELNSIRMLIERPSLTPYTGLVSRWTEFETRTKKEN